MKPVKNLVLFIILFTLLSPLGAVKSSAQREDSRYFPETGHSLSGEFLIFYESIADPIKIYGYPLTEAFQSQTTGRLVQYFQRTRFELHPENPAGMRVVLTDLGQIMYVSGPQLTVPPNFPACRTYALNTNVSHQVCYAFLDFFLQNGGIEQFGYPISEIETHEDLMVQYFQRARLEWHPELPAGQRVTLTDLGRMYFDVRQEDPALLMPYRPDNIPQSILGLTVRAFPNKAVTALTGEQTVYVVVQDQNLRPVEGAQVSLTIHFPSGRTTTNALPPSDVYGISRLTFSFGETSGQYGIAEIQVTVTYLDFLKTTRTSFRLWW